MHFDQSLIEKQLQALRDKIANPVLQLPKSAKPAKREPKQLSATSLQIQTAIAEKRIAREEKQRLKQEAENLKVAQKKKRKLLEAEQKRQAKANKERQRLQKESEDRQRLPDRVIDYSSMKSLRIDARTEIMIPRDQDPDEARRKYFEKHSKPIIKKEEGNFPPVYEF